MAAELRANVGNPALLLPAQCAPSHRQYRPVFPHRAKCAHQRHFTHVLQGAQLLPYRMDPLSWKPRRFIPLFTLR